MKTRVEVLHGVNFDVLGQRDPRSTAGLGLTELEVKIRQFARDAGLDVSFYQSNHEGEYCEFLHRAGEGANGLILNPGAWTHYSWAIHDALEVAGLPAVEVHLGCGRTRRVAADVGDPGPVRGVRAGKGAEGYRKALRMLKEAMQQ